MSKATTARSGTLASVEPEGSMPVEFVTIAIPLADYENTLAAVRQRIADGESTPVLCSHLDALGLRDVVEALARDASD